MSEEVLLTQEGLEKLKAELHNLKSVEKLKNAQNLREAKSHGDLKENAAYHEAKLNQQRLNDRIGQLERAVMLARIVERPKDSDGEAHLGSTVKLLDLKRNDEFAITLVGSFEIEADEDMVAITSPLGSALVGRKVGDEIEYEAPAGIQEYKIVAIGD